jgi:MFS family permease
MSTTGLLINFGVLAFQPFIPLYLRTLQANITDITLVFVAMQLAATLISVPGGILADRFGRKSVIVIGNAVGFGVYFLLLGANSWTSALLVLFAATIFATMVQPAYSSTVAESVSVENRSRAFGSFFFFIYLGLALGSAVGGYYSNRIDILIVGTAGLSAAIVRLVLLRETLPKDRRRNRIDRKRFFVAHMTRNIWLVLLALSVYNFSSGLGQPLYAIFSTDILQLSRFELGVMVSFGYVASILGAFFAGQVSMRLGVTKMMIVAIILASSTLVPWLYSPTVFFAILIFAVSSFFAQFFFVGNQALMANVTQAEERASVIGFITTVAGFSGVVAPYVGGQLWNLLDPRTPFIVSAVIGIAVAAPIAFVRDSSARGSCPHCARLVPKDALFCDICGKPIRFKKCVGCDRILEEQARFCDLCGRDQPKQNAPQERIITT